MSDRTTAARLSVLPRSADIRHPTPSAFTNRISGPQTDDVRKCAGVRRLGSGECPALGVRTGVLVVAFSNADPERPQTKIPRDTPVTSPGINHLVSRVGSFSMVAGSPMGGRQGGRGRDTGRYPDRGQRRQTFIGPRHTAKELSTRDTGVWCRRPAITRPGLRSGIGAQAGRRRADAQSSGTAASSARIRVRPARATVDSRLIMASAASITPIENPPYAAARPGAISGGIAPPRMPPRL